MSPTDKKHADVHLVESMSRESGEAPIP